MLIATSFVMSASGFMNKKNLVGFVTAEVSDLEDLIESNGVKAGDNYSEKVGPHRIITQEKVESELTADEKLSFREKINPSTEEILTKDGEPIYRRTLVVAEGSDLVDTMITHDTENSDEGVTEAQKEFAGQESSK